MSELPPGWVYASSNDLFEYVSSGSRGWAEYYSESGSLFLRIGNLDRGTIELDLRDVQRVKPPKEAEGTRTRVQAGDLVISITADLGMVGVIPEGLGEAYVNQHIALARPKAGIVSTYLGWFVASKDGQAQLQQLRRGMTKAGLGLDDIRGMDVPCAPVNEQRRIVAKLEALQARSRKAREALDEVPALLEKLRQSILAAAFRGDLTKDWRAKNPDVEPAEKLLQRIRVERRKKWEEAELAKMKAKGKLPGDDRWKAKYEEPAPVDTSGLPDLPKGWCWLTVEELCPITAPAVYGIILPGDDIPGGVPYLRPIDMRDDGTIDFSSVKRTTPEIAAQYARASLRTGDVVLSIVGTIGKVVLIPPDFDGANITQSSIRIRPPEWLPSEYVRLVLLSPQLTKQYDRFRFGNAVQRLNVEHVRRLAIPIMPAAEVPILISNVGRALGRIPTTAVTFAQEELQRLDAGVLAKAFRGKLVPQDPSDEPAAVMLERLKIAAAAPQNTTSAENSPKRARRGRPPKA